MHVKKIITGGKELNEAKKVLILLHGRGADASDIMSLASHLNVKDFALIAPQASNNTWYPLSFLAPPAQNEPWLSSALLLLSEIVDDVKKAKIPDDNIYFLGFSQGACLTLEFTTRNARRWGGVVAFTGGLIGDKINSDLYKGDFSGTPVFIGTSDPDFHVPVERVRDSARIMEKMNARVSLKIYKAMGHTVNQDEIQHANALVFA